MIIDHLTSVTTALQAKGLTVVQVVWGEGNTRATPPTQNDYPYAVLAFPPPLSQSESLGDLQEVAEFDFEVTSVGLSPQSALWAADKVHAALAGVEIAVTGRLCRISSVFADAPQSSTDVADRVVLAARSGFTLTSRAA